MKFLFFSTFLIFFSIFIEKNECAIGSTIKVLPREIIGSPNSILDFVKSKNAQALQDKVNKCLEPLINSPNEVFIRLKQGAPTCNTVEIETFSQALQYMMAQFLSGNTQGSSNIPPFENANYRNALAFLAQAATQTVQCLDNSFKTIAEKIDGNQIAKDSQQLKTTLNLYNNFFLAHFLVTCNYLPSLPA